MLFITHSLSFTYQTHCPLLGSYIISSHPSLFHLNVSFSLLSFRVSLLTLRADQGEDRVTEMHVNDLKALIDSSQGEIEGEGRREKRVKAVEGRRRGPVEMLTNS